jgi:hypothetical protein
MLCLQTMVMMTVFTDYGSGGLEDELETWNEAFNIFKICQPCKAYDLVSIITTSNGTNLDGDRYVPTQRSRCPVS